MGTITYVNSSLVFDQVPTTDLSSGFIGTYAWWSPMKFDDFKVYANIGSDTSITVLTNVPSENIYNPVTIYPNPNTDRILCIDLGKLEGKKTVSIIATNGSIIYLGKHDFSNTLKLNLKKKISKGIYFVHIEGEHKTIKRKVVVF